MKICKFCNKDFIPNDISHWKRYKYCSKSCSDKGKIGKKRKPFSVETRRKMSEYAKTRKYSLKTRLKMRLSKLGKKQSESQVKKRVDKLKGNKNFFWKGINVSYRGLHSWIVRNYGQPQTCEECSKPNLVGHKIHWANISGRYKRDRKDWKRLCAKCHKAFDTRIINISYRF